MNKKEVISLLKSNKDERGINHWNSKVNSDLESFGIGLTKLRKLAKEIGKNHDLSLELWESNIYDARTIAILIDEPKKMTREQIESQVDKLNQGHLAHAFSSCGAPLGKVAFVMEIAKDWINSDDRNRIRCGYGLIYEESKSKKKNAPSNEDFLTIVNKIDKEFKNHKTSVLGAMGGALMGIGKRNPELNKAALKVAKKIGPIYFNADENNCEPFDVVKHLTSDYLKNKFSA